MANSAYWSYQSGECVYGLVVNYHVASLHSSWRQTNVEIFGRTHVRLHPVLPCNLNCIASHLRIDPKHLLKMATGYPLYALSLGESASTLAESLCRSDGSNMTNFSRQSSFALPLDKHLKYCQSCLRSSFEQHGKLVWLTEHQLYGVSYCEKHHEILRAIVAGEGGVNRRYVLPENGIALLQADNEKARFLSEFIIKLFRFMAGCEEVPKLTEFYRGWLQSKELMTANGNIRVRLLSNELRCFWLPLFETTQHTVPLELSRFNYISDVVHGRRPVHYLKHVMLMAYLTPEPEKFFSETVVSEKPVNKAPIKPQPASEKALELLYAGLSLRNIANTTEMSLVAIKQLAGRYGISINKRPKKITNKMERDIWRKAFVGMHRADVAQFHNVSLGAVEQIIQSHKGLSEWRHHLLMCQRKAENRKLLLERMQSQPDLSRGELKNSCSSYMWLYKNDKEWLYDHLPPAQSFLYHPSLDWAARDNILAIKMRNMIQPAASLSALDRQLGAHGWLLKYADKLPKTMVLAQEMLRKSVDSCGKLVNGI